MTGRLQYFIFFVALTAIVSSCTSSKKDTFTYFGGKIKNPKSNQVLLFKDDKTIDTIFLDADKTFLGKYDSLPEGLYHFKHGPEHQFIYIEPNDSILIRLNTWDFDETLVFSGVGSEKNNILIECFLDTEKETKAFYKYYKLSPTAFKTKTDSILKIKKDKFDTFKANNPNTSKKFLEVLDVSLNYPVYAKLENYPALHKKKGGLESFPDLPEDFYSHRKTTKFDLDYLQHYYAFREYFFNRIYADVDKEVNDEKCDNYIVSVLNSINKNVASEETKNSTLRRGLIYHLYRESSCALNREAFHRFFELSTNIEDKKQIQRLLNDSKKLDLNSKVENFEVYNYSNAKESITDLITNKNSVIYFWNEKFTSDEYIASKIKLIEKKYPKLNLVGIKFGENILNYNKGLDVKSQYYIDSDSKANLFLTSKLPRTILVNKKGKVVNGFATISSNKIFNQLKELEKK